MKKVFLWGFLTFFLILGYNSVAAAESTAGDAAPHTLLNLYEKDNTLAVGLKQKILYRFYLVSDVEYVASSSDLTLQTGAVFFIPYKVDMGVLFGRLWAFNIYLYPGAGLQYFRNTGKKYGYLLLGANYLFFFTESIYPMQSGEKPEWRTGLSINL